MFDMHYIGKSKIGSLSARKGVKYPQLRLPQKCADVIGNMADIFETESEGKRVFLIVTDQAMPKGDSVLKPSENVLKPVEETAVESHSQLSNPRLSNLNQLFFQTKLLAITKIENKRPMARFEPASWPPQF